MDWATDNAIITSLLTEVMQDKIEDISKPAAGNNDYTASHVAEHNNTSGIAQQPPEALRSAPKGLSEFSEEAVKTHESQNLQAPNLESLHSYTRDVSKSEKESFSEKILKIMADANALELFKDERFNLYELSKIPSDILRDVLGHGEAFEMVKKGEIELQVLIDLKSVAQKHNDIFSKVLDVFVSAVKNEGEHGFKPNKMVEFYSESKLHLEVLANSNDLNHYVLTNFLNSTLVQFAVENYSDYLDEEWLREKLIRIGEDFDLIGAHEETSEYLGF